MTLPARWKKSSFSDQAGNDCVEVRGDLRSVRDTKHPEAALEFASATALTELAKRLGR